MNRSILLALLLVGGVGTGCALLIVATYAVLHVPLPFSVLLSCVVMTAAVGVIAFRAKARRDDFGGYAFAPTTEDRDSGNNVTTPVARNLLLLPPAGVHADGAHTPDVEDCSHGDSNGRKGESLRTKPRFEAVELQAISLFELPQIAREEAA